MKSEDKRLATLDELIADAEAAWADEISTAALWPVELEFDSRGAFVEAEDRFHQFLCGEEARQISRILFLLKATPVNSVEAMQSLIDGHNQQVQEDIDDKGYDHRTKVPKDRLRKARMISRGETDILLSAVALHGAGVLHVTAYRHLLVRISNLNKINKTVDVLSAAGLIRTERTVNNAKLVFSNGALEAAHRNYLKTIEVWVKEEMQ